MALDPRIPLAIVKPEIEETFNDFLRGLGEQQRQEQQAELQPLRSQLLQTQVGQAQSRALSERDKSRLTSLGNFASQVLPSLQADNPQEALSQARSRLARMQQTIRDNPGIQLDTAETQEFINLLESGTPENQLLATERAEQALQLAQSQGLLGQRQSVAPSQKGQARTVRRGDQLFSQQEIFNPNTGQIEVVETPIEGELVQRSTGRTTQESVGFAGDVADIKFQKKLKFAPQIAKDIAKRKQEVQQRGGVFTDLNQAEAALPGIKSVVEKLKTLSGEATFTLGGRVLDEAAKQVFGIALKGGTARSKMISLIDNQVLPLLKPIFGSQFTEREGDSLKKAFADPDSTPESRRAQLDSFLSQMERNIDAKRLELQGVEADRGQQAPAQQQVIQFDAQGNIIQ